MLILLQHNITLLYLCICASTCIEVHIVNKYLFKKGLKYKGSAILIVSHVNAYKTLNSDSAVLKATAHSNQLLLSFAAKHGDSNNCCVCNFRLDILVSKAIHCRGRISGGGKKKS